MVFWAIAAVALVVAVALAARVLASMPKAPPRIPDARPALGAASGAATGRAVAGTLPGPELVIRAATRADPRPLDPLPAPDVDLSAIGLPDDKDHVDRELWRAAKARLEPKS